MGCYQRQETGDLQIGKLILGPVMGPRVFFHIEEKMRKQWCVWGTILVLILGVGVIGFSEGVNAGSFVRDGIGARAFGMGGAFVSIADGVSTTLWNPAGLAKLDGINVGGMYTDKFGQGIYFQSVGATVRLFDLGAGLTMARSSIEDIPFYGGDQGGFFSETQTLLVGSVGYDLNSVLEPKTGSVSALLVGGNAKYYSHSLLEGNGQGFGFDLSMLMKLSFNWGDLNVGFTSLDIGGTALKWSGTDHNPVNNVPWINKIGVSVGLLDSTLRLAADFDVATAEKGLNRLHVGAEYWPVEQLGVRAGLILLADGGRQFSAGASVNWHGLSIDYAFVPHQALGSSHILSAHFHFAGWWDDEAVSTQQGT